MAIALQQFMPGGIFRLSKGAIQHGTKRLGRACPDHPPHFVIVRFQDVDSRHEAGNVDIDEDQQFCLKNQPY